MTAPTPLARHSFPTGTIALDRHDDGYLISVEFGGDVIEVFEANERTAKLRYQQTAARLKSGLTFAWLRRLVLTFQPAEEATTCP